MKKEHVEQVLLQRLAIVLDEHEGFFRVRFATTIGQQEAVTTDRTFVTRAEALVHVIMEIARSLQHFLGAIVNDAFADTVREMMQKETA